MEVGSFVQSRRFEKSSAESIVNAELMLIGGLLIFIGVLHAAWGGAWSLDILRSNSRGLTLTRPAATYYERAPLSVVKLEG